MTGVLIGFLTVILVLASIFVVLIVLMQRASANSGMGSALGGGAAESALGGEAGNVLTKGTIIAASVFFFLAFVLYLMHMAKYDGEITNSQVLPEFESAPAETPAEPEDKGLTDIPAEGALAPAETDVEAAVEAVEEAATEVVNEVTEAAEAVVETIEDAAEAAKTEGEAAVESLKETPVTLP